MFKAKALLRQGRKALEDLNLLKALQSEIKYEHSSNAFQESRTCSLGDFVVDCDLPWTQDVVLKRKFDTGEEVAISALLGPLNGDYEAEGMLYPRDVMMKVCVKKPGLSSILQFDCSIFEVYGSGSGFDIHNAYCLRPSVGLGPSVYRGPAFSSLDDELQDAFREYLESKGIGESLTNYIIHHLHRKEQGQYVNWLHLLESYVTDQSDKIQ